MRDRDLGERRAQRQREPELLAPPRSAKSAPIGRPRRAGGPALAAACEALPLLPSDTAPRDIQRWESTAKRGVSARVRCRVARRSRPAFGPLLETTRHVIHAVAPDAEFGYEGHYQGAPGLRGDKRSAPPLVLLRSAFASALDAATVRRRAPAIAVASLGAGVKGWRPAISAGVALDAVATMAGAAAPAASSLAVVEFVIGEKDDAAWVSWGASRGSCSAHRPAATALASGNCRRRTRPPTRAGTVATGGARVLLLHQVDAFAYFAKSSEPRDGWAGEDWRPTENGW